MNKFEELSKYPLGVVVSKKRTGTVNSVSFGHVLGFTNNAWNDIVIKVQWSDGHTSSIHPTNLETFNE